MTTQMNRQTQQAFEILMNDRNGRLIADVHRELSSTEDTSYIKDLPTVEAMHEAESLHMAWRLAWKIGQAVGRNEWPGHLATQSQLDKIDFKAICRQFIEDWATRDYEAEVAQLAEIRASRN